MNNGNEVVDLMIFDDEEKTIEEKIFIILYKLEENDNDELNNQIYSICVGRTSTYNDIKEKLSSGLMINIHESKIITETLQLGIKHMNKKYFLMNLDDCISIYTFCKSFSNNYDDDFDIEDYNSEYVKNEDSHKINLTDDQSVYVESINNKGINMSQLLISNNGTDV